MVKISRRRLAKKLADLLKDQPANQQQVMRMAAAYLVEQKQTHQAHLLVNDIADELMAADKHLYASVQSAFALGDQTRGQLVDFLKQACKAQTVELNETKDPVLIGGVVVRTPHQELDASVRRQIKQIAGGIL